MMKKVRNADGFSFVEVIIALGILSVVSLMIVRFMTTSSVTYSKANADVELQSEAQVVANNIKEKVMSCQHSTHFYDTSHPFTDGGNTYENALLINNEDDQILIYEDNSASSSKLMYIEEEERMAEMQPSLILLL